jgi:hypothetical protein
MDSLHGGGYEILDSFVHRQFAYLSDPVERTNHDRLDQVSDLFKHHDYLRGGGRGSDNHLDTWKETLI